MHRLLERTFWGSVTMGAARLTRKPPTADRLANTAYRQLRAVNQVRAITLAHWMKNRSCLKRLHLDQFRKRHSRVSWFRLPGLDVLEHLCPTLCCAEVNRGEVLLGAGGLMELLHSISSSARIRHYHRPYLLVPHLLPGDQADDPGAPLSAQGAVLAGDYQWDRSGLFPGLSAADGKRNSRRWRVGPGCRPTQTTERCGLLFARERNGTGFCHREKGLRGLRDAWPLAVLCRCRVLAGFRDLNRPSD